MTKIATCLSGHTRTYKKVFPNFNYDTDVFISSCIQSGLPPESLPYLSYHHHGHVNTDLINHEEVINLYNTKAWEFLDDNYIPEELKQYEEKLTLNNCKLIHVGMMFYRMYKANELKKAWEYKTNSKYDYVVRSRFDVVIEEINFEPNKLFIMKDDKYIKDLFFYGSSSIIDQISDCYKWFVNQSSEFLSSFENAEHILSYYVNWLNLNIEESNRFYFILKKDDPIQVNHFKNGEMWVVYG